MKKYNYTPVSELSKTAREARRRQQRAYYRKNKAARIAYARAYYKENKEKYAYKPVSELTPEQAEKRRAKWRSYYAKQKAVGVTFKKPASEMTKTEIEIRKCADKIAYYKKRREVLKARLADERKKTYSRLEDLPKRELAGICRKLASAIAGTLR